VKKRGPLKRVLKRTLKRATIKDAMRSTAGIDRSLSKLRFVLIGSCSVMTAITCSGYGEAGTNLYAQLALNVIAKKL
jgi:hypothetical protein